MFEWVSAAQSNGNEVFVKIRMALFASMVLDEMSSRNPKAKGLQPSSFIDVANLKELEQSGFVKSLYSE